MSQLVTIDDIIARVSEWQGKDVSHEVLIGGLANRSWVVTVDGVRFVAKAITEAMGEFNLMIPSADIIRNTTAAGAHGVGARVLYAFGDMPALVMEFIDGRTLQTADLSKPEMIPRLAQAVARLHATTDPFDNEIQIWGYLDDYLELVRLHSLPTPPGLLDSLPLIEQIRAAIAVNALPFVPSNNDLLPLNVMDDGDIRLIDYDFSGMNDPMFDLGDLAMEGDYSLEQIGELVAEYLGHSDPVQHARAALFGIAAQFTWTLLFIGMAELLPEAPAEGYSYHDDAAARWAWTESKLADPGLAALITTASA